MNKGRKNHLLKAIVSCFVIITMLMGNISVVSASTNKTGSKNTNLKVAKVLAKKKNPTDIKLNYSDLTLKVGESKQLKVTLSPKKNVNTKVKYVSDDSDLISVSSSGVVKGLSEGTCHIVVSTVNGLIAECAVNVISADSTTSNDSNSSGTTGSDVSVTGITMSSTATVPLGGTYVLTPTISPSNATNKTITYSLSNDYISITSNGVITGLKYGQTIVIAKSNNGITAICVVTVSGTATSTTTTDLTSIYLSSSEVSIGLYAQYAIKPVLYPSTAITNITYISSDKNVASVDSNGVVTGLSKGTAIIYVLSSNQKSASCIIHVTDQNQEVTNIQFAQANVTVNVNNTVQLTTYSIPSNATNTSISYISTDPTVATVSSSGLVTGIKAGTTKIIASTSNGKYAECTVTVSGGNISSVSNGTIIINGYPISMGDTADTLITKLGTPVQTDSSSYGFQYFIYRNSTNGIILIAIYNGKVAGFVQPS
ncbi:Ig-like domain-containing protein [Anaeromicropila herbilytica]|uniref:BIG2 domain-containing protein n=1 Tax=Anaeromicropila herbilytica TaxID=2785025 RepID=A0A7R7EJZ2_9FIRM|nr:Ig-like domain-containing protein [Anaeromicropila herbilytica]BCN30163.1 hypothetical protein bsdtb5_14580 [Anaeromicropila herbilytica]